MKSLFCLLLIVALCFTQPLHSETGEIVSVVTGEWAPWTGKKLPEYGFVNDVVRRAFATQGKDVKFQFLPWARAYVMMEQGKFDAASYAYSSSERREKALYSDPLTEEQIVFYSLKSFEWKKLSDLEDYRIGITLGNSYTDEFREMVRSGKLESDPHTRDLLGFRKLLAGRIDIFPCSELRGEVILRRHFTQEQRKKIHVNPRPLGTVSGYLLFPKARAQSRDLRATFNRGLAKIRADGTYEKLKQGLKKGKYAAKRKKD